mmetsp:Transcript_12303/g.40386  ORF Transcript_12303/g.40386 Transcript_12303/m.40386 type:complete len:2003 (+) Transcript_12303:62-6070(+)
MAPVVAERRNKLQASFSGQLSALARNNLTLQRRAWRSNCCLIILPLFLTSGLALLQWFINTSVLDVPELRCGCACVSFQGKRTQDTYTSYASCVSTELADVYLKGETLDAFTSPEDFCSCKERDSDTCGLVHSTASQAGFCAVERPELWPAFVQVPFGHLRAESGACQGETCEVKLLATGSSASAIAPLIPPSNEEFELSVAWMNATLGPMLQQPDVDSLLEMFGRAAEQAADVSPFQRGTSITTLVGTHVPDMLVGTAAESWLALYFETAASEQPYFLAEDCATVAPAAKRWLAEHFAGAECATLRPEVHPSAEEVNTKQFEAWRNWRQFSAGFDFGDETSVDPEAPSLHMTMWFNNSNWLEPARGPPTWERMPGSLNAAVSAWVEAVSGRRSAKLMGVREMPKESSRLVLEFSSLLGPLFYMFLIQLMLPVMLQRIVYEKESRVRIMMKMQGLNDETYFVVSMTYYIILYVAYMFVLVLFGSLVGLKFFLLNDYGIQILFYFLYGCVQVSFAFCVKSLFKTTKAATVTGYLYVFGTTIASQVIIDEFIESKVISNASLVALECIPCVGLYRGLYELANYAFVGAYQRKRGMGWSNLSDPENGLEAVLGIFVVEIFVFTILALYLDQVLDEGSGVRKHPLYFLDRLREKAPSSAKGKEEEIGADGGYEAKEEDDDDPNDVAEERERVVTMTPDVVAEQGIVVRNLRKQFRPLDGSAEKVACRDLHLAIRRGECVGLLGPNGAGKTTTIRMLCGFLEPSSGSAAVEGFSIRSQMDNIYSVMGVCPQDDCLWGTLTAREHLLFYGRLKNLRGAQLEEAIEEALRGVNLLAVANKKVMLFSGGMKRRLSVALALIGKPLVIYLDEPSTGLDPASRRSLWRCIKNAKGSASIILTSHSMEEAEVLCDRIGIFVDGRLRCIGAPKELTARHGSYLSFSITAPSAPAADVSAFARELAPSAVCAYSLSGSYKFELPINETSIESVFQAMASDRARSLNTTDWGVCNVTMEDVFAKVAGAPSNKSKTAEELPHPEAPRPAGDDVSNGFMLWMLQVWALGRKHVISLRRNLSSSIIQLASGFFFTFLLYLIDLSVRLSQGEETYAQNLYEPSPIVIEDIPDCYSMRYRDEGKPCYDFLYTPNTPEAAVVADAIREYNTPPIPADRVMAFDTPDDVDGFLFENPETVLGAYHFEFDEAEPSRAVSYALQLNSTPRFTRTGFEDQFDIQLPLQMAAERAFARLAVGDGDAPWHVAVQEFAHPALDVSGVVETMAPLTLFAAIQFTFVIQISSVVTEKHRKLRAAMKTAGMMDSAWWVSWFGFFLLQALLNSLLLVAFGHMFGFSLYSNNDFSLLFCVLLLFSISMTSFGFAVAACLQDPATATSIGFFVFLIGFVMQITVAFGVPYDPLHSDGLRSAFSLFPPCQLSLAIGHLVQATNLDDLPGLSWSNRRDYCQRIPWKSPHCSTEWCLPEPCVWSIADCFDYWLISTVMFLVLAVYLDNVMPDVYGNTQPLWYFLTPSYWSGTYGGGGSAAGSDASRDEEAANAQDKDVAEEEAKVKASAGEADEKVAVQLRGLAKRFGRDFWAVKGQWLNIAPGNLFCLLGHNGAGKSTTINMLTGVLPPTSGDALVMGRSLCSAGGLRKVSRQVGNCPQFDILWEELTGIEHLELFAALKGESRRAQVASAKELMEHVGLTRAANLRASAYSGGMARRLSVAISLVGNPRTCVYLDEPTTGMDPISRKQVWEIITQIKTGRAIVLTTHSMEEADTLGDRIGIMANGELRCLGSTLHLKQLFGAGYQLTVSCRAGLSETQQPAEGEVQKLAHRKSFRSIATLDMTSDEVAAFRATREFFEEELGVSPSEETSVYLQYAIPKSLEPKLPAFFVKLRERRDELGITDLQLALSTLEEVFLRVSKQAEFEKAVAEKAFLQVSLVDGYNFYTPIGGDAVPSSNPGEAPLKLTWEPDENGKLMLAAVTAADDAAVEIEQVRAVTKNAEKLKVARAIEAATAPK